MLKPQQSIERLRIARIRRAKRAAEEDRAAKANEAYEKHCNDPRFIHALLPYAQHGNREAAILCAATMVELEKALEARKVAEAYSTGCVLTWDPPFPPPPWWRRCLNHLRSLCT